MDQHILDLSITTIYNWIVVKSCRTYSDFCHKITYLCYYSFLLAIEKVIVNITRLNQVVGPSHESINAAVFAIRESKQCKTNLPH